MLKYRHLIVYNLRFERREACLTPGGEYSAGDEGLFAYTFVGVQEIDLRVGDIAVLYLLMYIFLVPMLQRLKHTDIERLKKVSTVRGKLKRYDLVLLTIEKKLVAHVRAMAIEDKHTPVPFALLKGVIMEMDQIFHREEVVGVA